MSAMLEQFHFLHPAWLWLLAAWPMLLWWLLRTRAAATSLSRLVDQALLPYLLDTRGRRRHWPSGALLLAGALISLALAGPAWQRIEQPLYATRAAQVVLLSLSPRMLATDLAPDRLARARYKVHDLLAANRGGQNALVAYAGEAFTVAPLTTDADALDDLLDALAPDVMPVAGDDAAAAIRRGVELLQHGDGADGSLVLVTDDADDQAIAAARQARQDGVRVSVLGVGGDRGVPVRAADGFLKNARGDIVMARRNDAHLQALATAGGGRYVPMRTDHRDIDALAGELRSGGGSVASTHARSAQWRDMGPWLLLPLLPLSALAFRRGWVLSLLLLLVLPAVSLPARAAVTPAADTTPTSTSAGKKDRHRSGDRWQALWLTPDQRAARALAAGDADRARKLARDPALRGSAAYRAGDFKAAAKAFAAADGGDAQYNLGNALARQGQYQQALAAYARALQADPHDADAAANRKAIRDWLRQQQQHRPQSNDAAAHGSGEQGQDGQGSKGDAGAAAKDGKGNGDHNRQDSRHGKPGRHGRNGSPAHPAASASAGKAAPTPARAGSAGTTPRPGAPAHAGSSAGPRDGVDAAAAAQRKAQAEQARKALKREMDRQLGRGNHGGQPYALGAAPTPAASSGRALPQAMQQELQRVPDDPGGLLRRKFMLEYQRRHGAADDGGSP